MKPQGELIRQTKRHAIIRETLEGKITFAIWDLRARPIEKVWTAGTRRAAQQKLRELTA